MLARLVEAAGHREHQGEAPAQSGIEHGVVAARGSELVEPVDRLAGRRRAVAEPERDPPDHVPSQHLIPGGLGVGERPLERREALLGATLASERP